MIATLLLALLVNAQDPVRVRAQLTEDEVAVGQTTILRVEVETGGPRARIQEITSLPPGLELVGTRDSDQRQFSLPGGGRRFVSRDHVLRPTVSGRYQVPAVEVVVDGRHYSSQPLLLTVTGGHVPGHGGAPASGDGVILRTWLDADTAYVGQQVTLNVEILFSRDARLRLRRAPEYEPPSPSGFWVHDYPDPPPVTRGRGSDLYESRTFRRALFPIAPGQLEVPPAQLFYEMRPGVRQEPESATLVSDPLALVVLSPPEEGRPEGFTGAVGQLGMRAWLEPVEVAAGEAAVLSVEVRGQGNTKALPPPLPPAIPGARVFPPSEESELDVTSAGAEGWKRFSWMVIPRDTGELEIPDVSYPVFDPVAGHYVLLSAEVLSLRVLPGTATVAPETPMAMTELRYLKHSSRDGDPLDWVRSPWFAGAQLIPVLLLGGAMLARRRRRSERSGRQFSARALRRRRRAGIRDLEKAAAAGDEDFLDRAERFAARWLADRLQVEADSAGREEALLAAGVPAETARLLRQVLQRTGAARYAPEAPDTATRLDLLRSLDRALERIDREAPGRRPRGQPGAKAAAALLVIAASASGGGAAAASPSAQTDFAAGVALYDAGRYVEAAEAFRRHLERRDADPAGWYNLAVAQYRAGEPGHAVWAWLNAARLDPRDQDTRHNLRIAGAAPELVARATPTPPLRPDELVLLAAVFWFLAAALGAYATLRGARRARVFATIALVVALGSGAASVHAYRAPETLVVLAPTDLRVGPNLNAESVAALAPGTGLVPVARQLPWIRVRTLTGNEGWVEAGLAGRIPDHATGPTRRLPVEGP